MQSINTLIILSSVLFLSACGSSGGGSSASGVTAASAVQGTDHSGTYRLTAVQCYSSTGAPTTTAVPSGANTQINIQGNSFTSSNLTSNCTLTGTGQIVFDASTSTEKLSGYHVATSTGGSCSETISFASQMGGTISPTSLTVTYANGQAVPDSTGSYSVDSSGNVYLFTTLQDSVSTSDLCFFKYTKL